LILSCTSGKFLGLNPIGGPAKNPIIEIEDSAAGNYIMVPVGATQAGSIVLEEASNFEKGDSVSHFEFGGSLVALVFMENTVTFDEDLLQSSADTVEARVLVGEGVGIYNPSLEQ
jgi:hypothetical protein